MKKWMTALVFWLCVLMVGTSGQAPAGKGRRAAGALTAMDYVEIRQLAARYAWAMDSGADNGYAYADLFAEDGEFVRPAARGREQLAALARGGKRGPMFVSHYGMSHVIEPSPQGATGKQYIVEINIDDNGPGPRGQAPAAPPQGGRGPGASQWDLVGRKGGELSSIGGHYEDVYTKTAKGWRFKSREFFPSQTGTQVQAAARPAVERAAPPPARPSSAAGQSTIIPKSSLTALDYLEIEKLVSSYGHALDSGFGSTDNGPAYKALFAEGGIFYSRGRPYQGEQLADLARAQPHGPQFIRHFLTNHVIEPSPAGATGKEYLVVIDVAERGRPGSIFLGGHYEDEYVKTPAGWRFKTRRSFGSIAGPQAASSSPSR